MTIAISQPHLPPVESVDLDEEDLFEIIDGKRVEKQMGSLSTKTAGIVGARLFAFLEASGAGDIYPEQSFDCFPDDPGGFRRPDISFIAAGRLADVPEEGHIPIAPDLAIEIVSPNDTVYLLDEKIADYQSVGVKLIWVINPQARAANPSRRP